jgi:tetratricopeptide (TPR) repeat protein
MSRGAAPRRGLALAEQAYGLVQVRPSRAVALAERAFATARKEHDPEAQVAALHALSWAQRVVGDPRSARTARAGIRIGEKYGARRRVALLRRNFSHALAFDGATRAAQREMDAALADLHGRDRAEAEVFRIALHRRARTIDPDAHKAVLTAAARALRVLEGDDVWQARLLHNRGALHLDRGELAEAEADLRRAAELYGRVGAQAAATDSSVGLAEIALMRGDLVGCLAMIDDVEASAPPGPPQFSLEYCRAVALAQARLLPEAAAAIDAYIELCSRSGRRDYVATALMDAATIAVRSGDASTALEFARRALRSFVARSKDVDAARARAVCLRAAILADTVTPSSLRAGIGAAAVLDTAGWHLEALRTHLLGARLALAIGSTADARTQLRLAMPLLRRGTAADRIELDHVRALLHIARDDRAAANRALKRGLRLLEDHRAALGAVELRATASQIGSELAECGLRLALESAAPASVLDWAERLRANALRFPFERPPSDRKLRGLLAELRRIEGHIRESERRGKPHPGFAKRRSEVENAIRARTRRTAGMDGATPQPLATGNLARALGDRVLVEYVELDGRLRALTLARRRLALHDLGEVSPVEQLGWLRFSLGRLARGRSEAARQSADAAASALDAMLVEPLSETIGDAALVIVPTGALHALPWAALPSLRNRSLAVAPSSSLWLRLAGLPRRRSRKTALIAGPGLRHATSEVHELAARDPAAIVLFGKAATAAAALAAIDGAALAHVACHGRFRADSPLFSSLTLADGPLTALDLQRLRRAPEVLVLSSCDLALSYRHAGDELLGFSAAMLAMGTRAIVASVVPVPDAAARRLMVVFHTELARGASPASALARSSPTLEGFVCLGVG